ncbi:hypothetical protein GCM10023176_08000 [Micromonospora coerulea]|uniref:Secreted protein n=1 Tax=Micromonospora coerulea TaxID=47856 RepID=A0ABP8S849_9ACTN
MILHDAPSTLLRRTRRALALTVVAVVAVVGMPATAASADHSLWHQNFPRKVHYSGGVARAAVSGSTWGSDWQGTHHLQAYDITVEDLSADGYRARVWVNIYKGCYCVSSGNRVKAVVFDNLDGANTSRFYYGDDRAYEQYVNAGERYTVEVKVGRYDGDTGGYDSSPAATHYYWLSN